MRILIRAEQGAGWKCQKREILWKRVVEEDNAQLLLSEGEKNPVRNKATHHPHYYFLCSSYGLLQFHSVLHKLQSEVKEEETHTREEKGLAIPG